MKPLYEYTVKEYAARERVHEATVRRWIDKGAVPIRRTPGGGIRVRDPHPTREEHDQHSHASVSDSTHPSRQPL